jgi:hypothetical protein
MELGKGMSFRALRKVLGLNTHNACVSFLQCLQLLKNDLTFYLERHVYLVHDVLRESLPYMCERKGRESSLKFLLLLFA